MVCQPCFKCCPTLKLISIISICFLNFVCIIYIYIYIYIYIIYIFLSTIYIYTNGDLLIVKL